MCSWARMLALEWKGRAFIEKVNSRCFCWFPAAILVHQNGAPIWRLHTKLYKGAWNVSANNSETVGHKDLRFGQIVYILVFYNISFSWRLPQDGFKCIFCAVFIAWQWKRRISNLMLGQIIVSILQTCMDLSTSWNWIYIIKKKTKLLRLTTRDAAPESYQVGPESLETFKPLPIKQGEKRKQSHPKLDFRRISQPKTQ